MKKVLEKMSFIIYLQTCYIENSTLTSVWPILAANSTSVKLKHFLTSLTVAQIILHDIPG